MTMDAMLEKQLETFKALLQRESIDPKIKAATRDWLYEQDVNVNAVLDPTGYETDVHGYLSREHDRAQVTADSVDDSPFDEPREEPLCTCSDADCSLKRGQLPPSIRLADDTRAGIQAFMDSHGGDPRVLREAQQRQRDRRERVTKLLMTCTIAMQSGVPPAKIASTHTDDGTDGGTDDGTDDE